MRIRAAWKLLEAGKRIRRAEWPIGRHLAHNAVTGYAMYDADGMQLWLSVTGVDRRADDWQEHGS